mmetsp:Transcript_78522/g.169683  ORF Transcript_78522/g.169683 Transcript_78522/m.169683 type:complete len:349 (-) Transcript_78522:118-1164(-)
MPWAWCAKRQSGGRSQSHSANSFVDCASLHEELSSSSSSSSSTSSKERTETWSEADASASPPSWPSASSSAWAGADSSLVSSPSASLQTSVRTSASRKASMLLPAACWEATPMHFCASGQPHLVCARVTVLASAWPSILMQTDMATSTSTPSQTTEASIAMLDESDAAQAMARSAWRRGATVESIPRVLPQAAILSFSHPDGTPLPAPFGRGVPRARNSLNCPTRPRPLAFSSVGVPRLLMAPPPTRIPRAERALASPPGLAARPSASRGTARRVVFLGDVPSSSSSSGTAATMLFRAPPRLRRAALRSGLPSDCAGLSGFGKRGVGAGPTAPKTLSNEVMCVDATCR